MMRPSFRDQAAVARQYLRREPESLTVGGYRNWLSGIANNEPRYWRQVWHAHVSTLGPTVGSHAVQSLSSLVQCLGSCAVCPLRFLPPETDSLCRDECLLLGLISAIQHGDDESLHLSASALACARQGRDILAPAGQYAISLKCAGRVLLPVSAEAINDIARQQPGPDTSVHSTLH